MTNPQQWLDDNEPTDYTKKIIEQANQEFLNEAKAALNKPVKR